MSAPEVTDRTEWRRWVVPRDLHEQPIHRWFVFPHSFTGDLVNALIDEWGLGDNDNIVDPFAGAGTTLVAARQRGVPASGFDLSPLAVLASNVKIANYSLKRLEAHRDWLRKRIRPQVSNGEASSYPDLVVNALRGGRLATLHHIKGLICGMPGSLAEKQFFQLALLSIISSFSRAVATGGWLSWRRGFSHPHRIPDAYAQRVELMLNDLRNTKRPRRAAWWCECADARQLPLYAQSVDAVITSPPYPNRHDYTRVFGVELMFGLLNWAETRDLRYQMFHSHPEARPKRPTADGYREPTCVRRVVEAIGDTGDREKVARMVRGYFLDMYHALQETKRVLKPGGRAALVVGNAQYNGCPLEVDVATAEIGEQCGLRCNEIYLVRERGNSAQQMGQYGRIPSRESIVCLVRS